MTTWRPVQGFERQYEVSDDGRVRTLPRELAPAKTKKGGHLQVVLGGKTAYVHRLVAAAFLDNPKGLPVVNHLNGQPADNRVANLEWATYGENIAHGYRVNGRQHYAQVAVVARKDGVEVARYPSYTAAARAHGITKSGLRQAVLAGRRCKGLDWARA